MSILDKGKWEAPFWGASKKFISGMDMLGMQNASVATYATLLPGLTNLTRRIRYYGLYVWLLEQYAKEKGQVSVVEFRRFIRRAELLFAFVISYQYPDERGVVGSQYATKWLAENGSHNIDIAAGADIEIGKKAYWQYSSGAFGQYFQGSLLAINLIAPIEKNKNIFASTPEFGRKLASYYGETITSSTRVRYLEAINRGSANEADLEIFGKEFTLSGIAPDSKEWIFYIDMLLGKDFPYDKASSGHTIFRRETVLLYMEYLNGKEIFAGTESFPRTFYYGLWEKKPFTDYTAFMGWHYYALNEFAHFSLETILWAFLVYLDEKEPIYLSVILEDFPNQIYDALKHGSFDFAISENTTFLEFSQYCYQSDINPGTLADEIKKIDRDSSFHGAAQALNILALIFQHDHNYTNEIKTYARKHNMYREGEVTDLLVWIKKYQEFNILNFIKKLLLHHIINKHIEIAMRKMRNRNENTLKFTLEDNILRAVDIVSPVWTSPRIDSLHQFLVDLKLVDGQQLTKIGEHILKENLK